MMTKLKVSFRCLGFLSLCLFITVNAMTQTSSLRGTVRDANGLPMAGASVMLEGTKKGTITDASGTYELKVSPGTYTLIIS